MRKNVIKIKKASRVTHTDGRQLSGLYVQPKCLRLGERLEGRGAIATNTKIFPQNVSEVRKLKLYQELNDSLGFGFNQTKIDLQHPKGYYMKKDTVRI